MYIFLSCSFQREDADVNDFVTGVLTGLGITFKNVSTASHRTPPDEAKKLMLSASAVVAVATRRDRLESGGYKMADSVRDEISIAYGLGRPLLLLVEEGIVLDGFLPNYGTFLEFERQSLARPVFVQRLIDAARNVALEAVVVPEPLPVPDSPTPQQSPAIESGRPTALQDTGVGQEAWDRFIARHHNLTGNLLRRLARDVSRAITTNDDELVVDHALTILSYDLFWKLLIERLAREQSITVRAVHSSTMDVWTFNPDLTARQRQFCEKGGKIVRVLCGRGAQPPADVLAAANMMMPHAEVLYYDVASLRVLDHTFTWDFAVTDHNGDAAIWESIGPAGVIVKAVFTSTGEYKGYDLRELWDEIAATAVPIRSERE